MSTPAKNLNKVLSEKEFDDISPPGSPADTAIFSSPPDSPIFSSSSAEMKKSDSLDVLHDGHIVNSMKTEEAVRYYDIKQKKTKHASSEGTAGTTIFSSPSTEMKRSDFLDVLHDGHIANSMKAEETVRYDDIKQKKTKHASSGVTAGTTMFFYSSPKEGACPPIDLVYVNNRGQHTHNF